MKNFQITAIENGKKYWISPSVAVCCVVMCEGAEGTFILAHKRGKGCPNEVGKWSVNCGYIDWYESLEDAVVREVYEEIGLNISKENVKYLSYNNPTQSEPNLTIRFTANVPLIEVQSAILDGRINGNTVIRGGEKDEVEEIKLIPIWDIDKYQWAFGHDKIIMGII